MAEKTPDVTPLRVPKHGKGKLRIGGTNKGGPGRPPSAFKDFLRKEIREAQASRDALVRASQDETLRSFGGAWKLAADYDDEKPAKRIQIDLGKLHSMTDDELAAIVKGKK